MPAAGAAGLVEAGSGNAYAPESLLDETQRFDVVVRTAGVDVELRQTAGFRPPAAAKTVGRKRNDVEEFLIRQRMKLTDRDPVFCRRVPDNALGTIAIEREELLAGAFWT